MDIKHRCCHCFEGIDPEKMCFRIYCEIKLKKEEYIRNDKTTETAVAKTITTSTRNSDKEHSNFDANDRKPFDRRLFNFYNLRRVTASIAKEDFKRLPWFSVEINKDIAQTEKSDAGIPTGLLLSEKIFESVIGSQEKLKAEIPICPHCHNTLPKGYLNADRTIIISMAGTPAAGKSVYIPTLIRALDPNNKGEIGVTDNFYGFNITGFNSALKVNTSNSENDMYGIQKEEFEKYSENLQYAQIEEFLGKDHYLPSKTKGDTYAGATVYNFNIEYCKCMEGCYGEIVKTNINFALFDIAGETFKNKPYLESVGRFVKNTDGLILFFDPTKTDVIYNTISKLENVSGRTIKKYDLKNDKGQIEIAATGEEASPQKQGEDLQAFFQSVGDVKKPIAIVMSKMQLFSHPELPKLMNDKDKLWKHSKSMLFSDNCKLNGVYYSPHEGYLDAIELAATSNNVENFIKNEATVFRNTLMTASVDDDYVELKYFCVSSLDKVYAKEERPDIPLYDEVKSYKIAEPLLWLFAKNKVIDCMSPLVGASIKTVGEKMSNGLIVEKENIFKITFVCDNDLERAAYIAAVCCEFRRLSVVGVPSISDFQILNDSSPHYDSTKSCLNRVRDRLLEDIKQIENNTFIAEPLPVNLSPYRFAFKYEGKAYVLLIHSINSVFYNINRSVLREILYKSDIVFYSLNVCAFEKVNSAMGTEYKGTPYGVLSEGILELLNDTKVDTRLIISNIQALFNSKTSIAEEFRIYRNKLFQKDDNSAEFYILSSRDKQPKQYMFEQFFNTAAFEYPEFISFCQPKYKNEPLLFAVSTFDAEPGKGGKFSDNIRHRDVLLPWMFFLNKKIGINIGNVDRRF